MSIFAVFILYNKSFICNKCQDRCEKHKTREEWENDWILNHDRSKRTGEKSLTESLVYKKTKTIPNMLKFKNNWANPLSNTLIYNIKSLLPSFQIKKEKISLRSWERKETDTLYFSTFRRSSSLDCSFFLLVSILTVNSKHGLGRSSYVWSRFSRTRSHVVCFVHLAFILLYLNASHNKIFNYNYFTFCSLSLFSLAESIQLIHAGIELTRHN